MKPYKLYIGARLTKATPMTRMEYCKYRGFRTGNDKSIADEEGYLVIHPDGYESWSPKSDFEEAYREANISRAWMGGVLS